MRHTFPDLDTQTLIYWEYAPDINYPLIEVFGANTTAEAPYFVQMFSAEGFGTASPCKGENEARTVYTLWTRGLELPEDVFSLDEAKEER